MHFLIQKFKFIDINYKIMKKIEFMYIYEHVENDGVWKNIQKILYAMHRQWKKVKLELKVMILGY